MSDFELLYYIETITSFKMARERTFNSQYNIKGLQGLHSGIKNLFHIALMKIKVGYKEILNNYQQIEQ